MSHKAVQEVPIDRLICRKQVRESFDEEELVGLAQSIRENGIVQALLGHREGSGFVLDDGERRLRAAKKAGLTTVPIVIDDHELSSAQVAQRQLVCNCQRSDLTPMEKARAIDTLMKEAKWSASEVALKLGMSAATVSRLLALLVLPALVQAQVAAGKIPASTGYELAKMPDAAERDRISEEVANGRLSRAGVVKQEKARKAQCVSGKRRRRTGGRRRPIVVRLSDTHSIAITGPSVKLNAFVEWIEAFVGRLRRLESEEMEFGDAVGLLATAAT